MSEVCHDESPIVFFFGIVIRSLFAPTQKLNTGFPNESPEEYFPPWVQRDHGDYVTWLNKSQDWC